MKRSLLALPAVLGLLAAPSAWAVGTSAGTAIDNVAEVTFEVGGTARTASSNTLTLVVAEVLDVDVTVQTPIVDVGAGDTARTVLVRVTNTGNGPEGFRLVLDNALPGDDFDPVAASPAIYFDTDGSGDLSTGDTPYNAGSNDPVLAADASVEVLLANDIPAGLADGASGLTRLTAEALTGTGAPGTTVAGAGEGGVDAVVGANGATGVGEAEYVVASVQLAVTKSAIVADPFGGAEPVPGATVVYTVSVTASGSGTAAAAELVDPVPANTTYVPGSLRLNAAALTDQTGDDAGELDTSGVTPAVTVRLGDLSAADGPQTVEFQVTID